jgi:hypothetical protein
MLCFLMYGNSCQLDVGTQVEMWVVETAEDLVLRLDQVCISILRIVYLTLLPALPTFLRTIHQFSLSSSIRPHPYSTSPCSA